MASKTQTLHQFEHPVIMRQYFTFNRADAQLKRRFEEGLAQIRSDGSYHQLFLRHFGELVRQSRLSERRLIRLQSEAPAGLPEADSSFWLQPSVE